MSHRSRPQPKLAVHNRGTNAKGALRRALSLKTRAISATHTHKELVTQDRKIRNLTLLKNP